jgi:uncharacterized DUF497 family protein
VLKGLAGFDWDEHNISHIGSHDVSPIEVQEAAQRRSVIIPAQPVSGEHRWKLFGKTAGARYLVVVFTIRRNKFRTVTAYPMNKSERRIYAPQIDNESA